MILRCAIAGCGDEAKVIHDGFTYCEHHQESVWELPGSSDLSGSQIYNVLDMSEMAWNYLFGSEGKPQSDAEWAAWKSIVAEFTGLVVKGLRVSEFDPSRRARDIWLRDVGVDKDHL